MADGNGAASPEEQLRKRRAALVGAAYHAHGAPYGAAPYVLKPLSLEEVTEHLERETDPVVKNHGAAWLLDAPEQATQERLAPYVQRIVGDRYPSVRNLRGNVGSILPPGNVPDPDAIPSTLFAEALKLLSPPAAHLGAPPCNRTNWRLQAAMDPRTLVTHVVASIDVDRAPSDFNVIADPQNWKRAGPMFFKQSDLGVFAHGKFAADPHPPAPGSTSYPLPGRPEPDLYELVTMSWNPFFPLNGRNVLRAKYQRCPPGGNFCQMDVSLDTSVSTVIGASAVRGGLDVDSGMFKAERTSATTTKLTATKNARFTERELCGLKLGFWLNLFAPYVLGPWLALLVYDGACAP
jgi:hypothetical protein